MVTLATVLIILAGVVTVIVAARAGQWDQRPQEPNQTLGGKRRRKRLRSQRP